MRRPEVMRRLGPLLALWVLVTPFACASLVLPFGRDQGIYAWTADRFLDGAALYRDIYVFKTPLTVWVHALALLLFDHTMMAIRQLDVGWTIATSTALYALLRAGFGGSHGALASRPFAVLAGVGWAYAMHHYDYWNTAQTDGWATLPLAAGIALALRGTARARFGGGVLVGVAILFKYTLGAMAPAALVAAALPALLGAEGGLSCALRAAGHFLAGLGAAALGFVLILALAGSWPEFVASQRDVVLPYAGAPSSGRDWGLFQRFLWLMPDPMVLAAPGGAALALWDAWRAARAGDGRRAAAALVVPLWLAGALGSLIVQGKFFPYHYLPVLAPLALCGAVLVARPLDLLPWERARAALLSALLLGGVAAAATDDPFPARWAVLRAHLSGERSVDRYWRSGRFKNRDMSLAENMLMADWIREHTPPDATVFLWTYDPMIYFLAERDMVSRFLYTYPMVVAWGPDSVDAELLAALRAAPPDLFVVGSHDATPKVMGHALDSAQTFAASGPIRSFVEQGYTQVERVKRFTIYARAPEGGTP